MLVACPEGTLRFWSEIGKPHTDQTIELNGEIAFSLNFINSTGIFFNFYLIFVETVHRFLVSTTTTTNFYLVEIFHTLNERNENLVIKSIEMNSPAGIGRRMSMLLFGFSNEKER